MAKATAITCIGKELKAKMLPHLTEDERESLKHIALCDEGNLGVRKSKRALSKYQEHMSVCMKGGGDFGGCVAQWRNKNPKK